MGRNGRELLREEKKNKEAKKEAKETQMEVQEEEGTGHSAFRAHNILQRCVQLRRLTLQQHILFSIKTYFD